MNRIPYPSRRLLAALVAAPFVIAACTTTATDSGAVENSAATEVASSAAAEESATTPPAAAEESAEPETATWLDIELTDAASGETFTLASLEGGVVAIEPMAVWCTNCKAQQNNVKQAYSDIQASGVTYVSLGIDPGEKRKTLAKYADRNDFPWAFAQSPVEFSRALSDLFGPQILSAPSTPLIVLDEEGEVVVQTFGFHGPDALLSLLDEVAA